MYGEERKIEESREGANSIHTLVGDKRFWTKLTMIIHRLCHLPIVHRIMRIETTHHLHR